MSERSNLISKLQSDFKARAAYIQAKVSTLVPSQIRGLRLKSDMPRQADLAEATEMHQSRISMFETAGANPTLSTLSAIAAGLKVGLVVKFVPFSEMLQWENSFSQDLFEVTKLENDHQFLHPLSCWHVVQVPSSTPTYVRDTLSCDGQVATAASRVFRMTFSANTYPHVSPETKELTPEIPTEMLPREAGGTPYYASLR